MQKSWFRVSRLVHVLLVIIPSLIGLAGRTYAQIDTSMVLDSNDFPRIAFRQGRLLKYAVYDGTQWTMEDVAEVAEGRRPYNISLALDSMERPHISYSDFVDGNDAKLCYAHHDGTAWSQQIIEPASLSFGEYGTSIALDDNDYPRIAYHHHRYGYDGKYAYYNGTSWAKEVFDSSSGYFAALALDSEKRACVSYFDGSRDLFYTVRNGPSSWSRQRVDSGPDAIHGSTRLVFDTTTGLPRIGYFSKSTSDLRYAAYDGTEWTVMILATGLPETGTDRGLTAFDLDNDGRPHFAYHDSDDNTVTYAFHDGTEWSKETISSTCGGYCDLVVTSSGLPIVCYYDKEDLDLKVAIFDGTRWRYTSPYDLKIVKRETQDTDCDGRIDRIRMKANKDLNDDFSGLAVTVMGYSNISFETGDAEDQEFFVLFDEGIDYDTGATPDVQITANSSLHEYSGHELQPTDSDSVPATDAAPPVIVSVSLADGVFQADVSEAVTHFYRRTDLASGDWTPVQPDPSGTTVTDTNATANRLFYTVAE